MPINYINLADIDRNAQNAQLGDLQIQNAQMARQDRERQIQAQQAAQAQQMQLRDIYARGGGDLNKTREELYTRGLYEQGAAVDKQLSEQAKSRSDVDKSQLESASKRINLIGNGMKFLVDNPTKENAMMTFNQLRSVGVLSPEQYDEYTAKLPDDPAMIRRGAEVLFRGALDAKDQLAKYETRDTGGAVATQQIDPVTGQVRTVSSISKTQTPDSIASNERMAREGALNRGVQIRGQDLTRRGQDLTNAREIQSQKSPAKATAMQLEDVKKVKDANDVLNLLNEAELILPESTGSKIGAAADYASGAFGVSTKGAQAAAKLKAIQGLLVSKMPKMSGPQSDKDVLLYREMAGQIGDPTIPAGTRRAAMDTIRSINERYAGIAEGSSRKPSGATGSFESPARNVRSEADKILGL